MSDEREPLSGGKGNWPMLDRNRKQIHVGDRIRGQRCTGRYGQVETFEDVVKYAHETYCQLGGVSFVFDHDRNVLIGYDSHNDHEHGHETFIEVIS